MITCKYGCGQEGKHTLKNGAPCCSEKYQSCPALRNKNSNGLRAAHTSGVMRKFTKQDRANSNKRATEKSIEECFCNGSNYPTAVVKSKLYKDLEYEHRCHTCGLTEWNNNYIVLELDHINGNNSDNRLENLRLLCPNCHAQTDTWRGRNVNKGKAKVSDEKLLTALERCANIRQALIEVGLAPKGANYIRAKRLNEQCQGGGTVYTGDLDTI